MTASDGSLAAFWYTLWDMMPFRMISKIAIAGLWIVATRLQLEPYFDDEGKMLVGGSSQRSNVVQGVSPVIDDGSGDGYVYDLTTESGRFAVGPGSLVVHNTDSVMVHLPDLTAEQAAAVGDLISDVVTARFFEPMQLENEGTFLKYILLNKKRYIALGTDDALVAKGVCLKRRDFPVIVKKTVNAVVNALVRASSVQEGREASLTAFYDILQTLVDKTVSWDELIIVKELNKIKYEGVNKPPHVCVAEKIRRHNPSRQPKPGDRISYLIVRGSSSTLNVGERSEDPVMAREHNMDPDYAYYATLVASQTIEILNVAGCGKDGQAIARLAEQRCAALTQGQTVLPWALPYKRSTPSASTPSASTPSASTPSASTSQKKRQTKISSFFGGV
jgi:hypothetical protein